jgi:hypothetical protein
VASWGWAWGLKHLLTALHLPSFILLTAITTHPVAQAKHTGSFCNRLVVSGDLDWELFNNELDRDSDCKAVVKFYWKKKEKIDTAKERRMGFGQIAQKLWSLFKGQFTGCEDKGRENFGWSLQEGQGWLTGLIDKVLLFSMGYSVHALTLISRFLIACMRYSQYLQGLP